MEIELYPPYQLYLVAEVFLGKLIYHFLGKKYVLGKSVIVPAMVEQPA